MGSPFSALSFQRNASQVPQKLEAAEHPEDPSVVNLKHRILLRLAETGPGNRTARKPLGDTV